MTRDDLQKLLDDLHANYTYILDPKQYGKERMDSHYDAFIAGDKWKDDCDGFAATAAEALMNLEVDPHNIMLIICDLRVKPYGGHVVCGVEVDNNTYILDCNFKEVYRFDYRNKVYDWKYYACMEPTGGFVDWYEVGQDKN